MGKILSLFDFEFKRNIRNYLIIILTFCVLLIGKLIMNLNSYNYIMDKIVRKIKVSELYVNSIGILNFDNLITNSEVILFLIGILACMLYSIIIWNKDFIGKNKSIYTLYMLPQNKVNIYISKFINIICLIYIYVISFVLTLFAAYNIMTPMMKGNVENFGFVRAIVDKFFIVLPYNFNSFIYNYVVVVTSIVSILFMIILFFKYINISKIKHLILSILMVIYLLFIFYKIYLIYISSLQLNIYVCLITTILNIFISYKLLYKTDL
ncbi:hypothetical protein [Faecalimicrobium dakarense]|uniref:hypothetical protein n=1 Tax=Faecalimicrobium dakarense TaxID=1301100 RepID=UPI0004B2C17D|nr:hypothetical protein [[Clostridium] dakarense]